MALTHEQRKIASLIVQIGRHSGRSRKEIVSALETGLVESNLRNLRGGDGSSVGWRQETASSYPGVNRRNVRQSIKRYYRETAAAGRGRGKTAGQLAADVQRPQAQYRGRYQQQRGTALSIYNHLAKGVPLGTGGTPGTPGSVVSNRTVSVTTPQADLSSGVDLTALLTQQQPRPVYASAPAPPAFSASNSLALPKGYATPEASPVQPRQDSLQQQLQAIASTAGPSVTHPQVNVSGSSIGIPGTPGTKGGRVTHGPGGVPRGTRHLKGVANFEGHKVAAWIKPWLVYGRKHGWKGQVNSGYRSYADQVRIYNSGVRPAAKPGQSNHEGANFPRGAVDVSNAAQLGRILQRAGAPLKFAGAKDPVHFSHPHGGAY